MQGFIDHKMETFNTVSFDLFRIWEWSVYNTGRGGDPDHEKCMSLTEARPTPVHQ